MRVSFVANVHLFSGIAPTSNKACATSFATVVLPVPASPAKIMWFENPLFPPTLMEFNKLRNCCFTFPSPINSSNCSMAVLVTELVLMSLRTNWVVVSSTYQ